MADTNPEKSSLQKAIEFENNRKGLVIEIGSGGPLTIGLKEVQKSLEEQDKNYLSIEIGSEQNKYFNEFVQGRKIDWAKTLQESVFRIGDKLNEKVNEVWIRNFRGISSPNSQEMQNLLFSKVKEMLIPQGNLLLVNTYDQLPHGSLERIIKNLTNLGFDVRKLDLEEDTHPLIAGYRRLESKLPSISLPGVEPTKYALLATKKE